MITSGTYDSRYPIMIFAKFGWNWPFGSSERDLAVEPSAQVSLKSRHNLKLKDLLVIHLIAGE